MRTTYVSHKRPPLPVLDVVQVSGPEPPRMPPTVTQRWRSRRWQEYEGDVWGRWSLPSPQESQLLKNRDASLTQYPWIFLEKYHPDSNIGWLNVGQTSILSSRRWANVAPTYAAVWAVCGETCLGDTLHHVSRKSHYRRMRKIYR